MKPLSVILVVAICCVAAGCHSNNGGLIAALTPTAVVTVEPTVRTLHVGDTLLFRATVTSMVSNVPVTWGTQSTAIITVQPEGLSATVKCVGPGLGVVTASAVYAEQPIGGGVGAVHCVPFVSVTATPAVVEANHKVGSSPCPQPLGTIEIRNPSGAEARTVQVKVESENPNIDVSPAQPSMAPGAGQVLTVTFNCRTSPPIATRIIVTITSPGVPDEVSIIAVNVHRS
jgi:hypothetical protein